MNWKYGTGLTLTILGNFLNALVWFLVFGVPLYLIGIILLLLSGKSLKAKLLGIFLPLLIPVIFWGLLWLEVIT
jgi:hypothetical protein